jgi:hypothetical protein
MSTSPQLTYHREIRLNKADYSPLSRFGIPSDATPASSKVDSSPESESGSAERISVVCDGTDAPSLCGTVAARRLRPGLRRGRITSPSTSWQTAAMAVWLVGRQCCVSRSAMIPDICCICRSRRWPGVSLPLREQFPDWAAASAQALPIPQSFLLRCGLLWPRCKIHS